MSSRVESGLLNGSVREGGHVVEMQRRRLLLAFSEILAEDGLEHAGVGRVCKRARVSRRTFYELFDDREACFTGVIDAAIEKLSGPVHAAYEANGRWRERVRAALTVLLECFEQDRALARVCLIETLKGGPEVLERRRRTLETLATAIEQGRAETKDGNGPPALTAQGIVGGVVSVLHAHIAQDDAHIAR